MTNDKNLQRIMNLQVKTLTPTFHGELFRLEVVGQTLKGKMVSAVAFGPVAQAMNERLKAAVGDVDDISTKRLILKIEGVLDDNPSIKRSFPRVNVQKFDLLSGLQLEYGRLKSDALSSITKAEELRKSGNLAMAYKELAEFTANFAGIPIDLSAYLEYLKDQENAEPDIDPENSPEARAAAIFAREDAQASADTKEVSVDAPADDAQSTPVEQPSFVAQDFSQDEELGVDNSVAESAPQEFAGELESLASEEAQSSSEPTSTLETAGQLENEPEEKPVMKSQPFVAPSIPDQQTQPVSSRPSTPPRPSLPPRPSMPPRPSLPPTPGGRR